MTDTQQHLEAAEQAAAVFAERGQADEWAVSQLMANRYKQQLTEGK
ncbi:hypothetical protein ABZ912_20135 [Nonomuraea angiospora]